MPLFEFDCPHCKRAFEQLVKSADAARSVTCPNCGSRKVERRFSVFTARSAAAANHGAAHSGGCGRCGDPNGPCNL